jgi:hypothetical protein
LGSVRTSNFFVLKSKGVALAAAAGAIATPNGKVSFDESREMEFQNSQDSSEAKSCAPVKDRFPADYFWVWKLRLDIPGGSGFWIMWEWFSRPI